MEQIKVRWSDRSIAFPFVCSLPIAETDSRATEHAREAAEKGTGIAEKTHAAAAGLDQSSSEGAARL